MACGNRSGNKAVEVLVEGQEVLAENRLRTPDPNLDQEGGGVLKQADPMVGKAGRLHV